MAACEICWTTASHKALMGLGMTADLYKQELEAHPNGHPSTDKKEG